MQRPGFPQSRCTMWQCVALRQTGSRSDVPDPFHLVPPEILILSGVPAFHGTTGTEIEEYLKVQEIFPKTGRKKAPLKADYPLYKKVRCGTCGRNCRRDVRNPILDPHIAYFCNYARSQSGEKRCSMDVINEEALHEIICRIWYRVPLRKRYECYKDVAVHIPRKQHNRVDEIIAFLQPAKEPEGQKRTPKPPRKRL